MKDRYEARRIQAEYKWSDAQLLEFLVRFCDNYIDPSKLHDLLAEEYGLPEDSVDEVNRTHNGIDIGTPFGGFDSMGDSMGYLND